MDITLLVISKEETMKYKHYTVYNDEEFFQKYNQKRNKGNSPNETIEQPIIDELVGEVNGKNIMDLGCGDGKYGVELLKKGAKHYYGIEGSINMASLAKENLSGHHYEIKTGDIEHTEFLKSEYDFIISRLVLHYIENLETLLNRIRESLKKDGEFIFSIEHPVITSCYTSYHKKVKRGNWIVDHYFDSGERINEWIGKKVVKYHRTIEEYWQLIQRSGFKVIDIRESKPIKNRFNNLAEYERRKRIPLFLFFKLKKQEPATRKS